MPGRKHSRLQQSYGAGTYLTNILPLADLTALLIPRQVAEDIAARYLYQANGTGTEAALSLEEESEFIRYNYRSRLPVFISGDTVNRAGNIIRINGSVLHLGDVPFALFIRLVAELFKNKGGMIRKSRLINVGYIKADGEFQAIGRLRQLFRAVLCGLDPQDFIETCQPGCLRLSTHPALISYNKQKLLTHRNIKIRRLARRLP